MTVRVEPAFDAKIERWLSIMRRPSEGWKVGVLYDPSNHRRVALDRSMLARQAAAAVNYPRLAAKAKQEFDELFSVEMQDAETVVDRLTKLMDLHDRGVLTDAEYKAEKQKLLGQ
jgi:hypothetical protein